MLLYPELVIEENPSVNSDAVYRGLTNNQRELIYKVLGNRSHAVVSMRARG